MRRPRSHYSSAIIHSLSGIPRNGRHLTALKQRLLHSDIRTQPTRMTYSNMLYTAADIKTVVIIQARHFPSPHVAAQISKLPQPRDSHRDICLVLLRCK